MIRIVDYDPQWPQVFTEIRSALAPALGALALSIEHVGSTAVPGLPAKPIIDIDIVIESEELISPVVRRLDRLGCSHQGNLGISGREAFSRVADDVPRNPVNQAWPEHHLYVCPQDSPELARHLAFRDYLRQHPEQAVAYGKLKLEIAGRCAGDRDAYTQAKTEFIEAIYRKVMVEIRPLRADEVEAAKQVITTVCFEFFGQAPVDFEDMDDIQRQYSGADGIFLVLVDDGKIVGTGAIRRLDTTTCELKRMWFLKPYRGQGLGRKMAQRLLSFAQASGYKKVRLDTGQKQEQAVRLYQRLGFYFIERYNDSSCDLFMEKTF